MKFLLKPALILMFWSLALLAKGQRSYAGHSVLAEGNWYQLAVTRSGVYQIDAALLQQMGISLPVASDQLRLYGRPGLPPGEACSARYTDDWQELPVLMEDGGDGQFNGSDYLMVFAEGPHGWTRDALHQRFQPVHNIYSDTSYLLLTLAPGGKRIQTVTNNTNPTQTITAYQYRYHYEQDLYNLLFSGKEWYGERFLAEALAPLNLNLAIPAPVPGSTAQLVTRFAARSVDATSSFQVNVGGAPVLNPVIASVTTSNLDLFARESTTEAAFPAAALNSLNIQFQPGNGSAIGWLNNFDCYALSRLQYDGQQLDFRSWEGITPGAVASYLISQASSRLEVWRITDPQTPVRLGSSLEGSTLQFTDQHEQPEEYLAFEQDPAGLPRPIAKGLISNQDLHGAQPPDMLVVTTPALLPAANRLADWHRQQDGINCQVVTTTQAYLEFSGGQPNPVAIRDLAKMYYDRPGGGTHAFRYLLLFGDASFDYKNRLGNSGAGVPAYESSISLDPLSTYVSDDFFGFLDDAEDINTASSGIQLDLGIGRIPAGSLQAANAYIDKLQLYRQPATRGEWRNALTFIADDEDFNLHLRDAESITSRIQTINDRFQLNKIYLDAYPQESDAAGSRYPLVNQAISDQMQQGTLIWNFNGHGGFRRLAEEVVLDTVIANSWQQHNRFPLFITATCDFAPYDNPTIYSLGEFLLLKPAGGAIALMTTTRLVFAYSNRIINSNYLAAALERQADGHYRTLGEAVRTAKNTTYQSSTDIFNNLKFTLLGDPAFRLAFPQYNVAVTAINGQPVSSPLDSIQAMEKITVEGMITDGQGQWQSGFNGLVFPQVLDKPYKKKTLANDPTSLVEEFTVQDQYLFKGKAAVQSGRFSFSFVVPKDLNYAGGNGAIRFYAQDSLSDASGVFDQLPIGGSVIPPRDEEGPVIRAWLNDTAFRDGGLVGTTPVLLLRLADSSGINVLGNGIGHDITLIIDGNTRLPLVLNEFFQTDIDTYQRGSLQFQLPSLSDGLHEFQIKAWDVVNNSSVVTLHCRVRSSSKLVIESALAWPNPSSGSVRFGINHNQGSNPLQAVIELFSADGHMVKTLDGTIIGKGNRSYMDWNGRDDRGNLVPPGVYFYRINVFAADGRQATLVKKLIRF